MRILGWVVAAMLAGGVVASAPPASAAPTTKLDPASEQKRSRLYQEGIDLAAKNDWEGAVVKFRAVVDLRPAPKALYTLADAEAKVGRLATARADFLRAREMAVDAGETPVAEASADAALALEAKVPRLVIEPLDGSKIVSVSIDDEARDAVNSIEIDPGSHRVDVQLSSGARKSETLDFKVGARTSLRVGEAPPVDKPRPPPPWAAVVIGGVGAALGLAGVGLYVEASDAVQPSIDACASAVGCSEAQAADGNAARGRMIAGDVLMAAGFSALGAGVIWFSVGVTRPAPEPSKDPVSAALGYLTRF